MAASQEQKVDFLLKKIGYVQSKTGIAEDSSISGTKKAPTEESKPSPLVVPGTSIWSDSTLVPSTPPTSNTSYVGIYTAANAFQLTHDNTVAGNRTFIARSTFGNQSASISGDWIDPSFGADYAVQVYKGDPDSGGVSLSPTGSGNSDEWFFDYSSGILNFNGTNVPSGITTTNVYLIGYKYTGAKGARPAAGIATFSTLSVSGISTFTGNIDANGDLDVDGTTELDVLNVAETATFSSNIDANGNLDVDGTTELDTTNISETLNVVGIATFASDVDLNAGLDVDGHTELDDVNVSTALTANNLVVTGSTLLKHSDSLKLQTIGIGVSISNGIGLTATIAGPSNLIIDPGVVGDNTGVVRIKGDLFVDGTQTQINSTTIELADFIVGIATTATSDSLADGAGIQIGPNNTFLYEHNSGTNPSLKSSENLNVASGKVYQVDQTEVLSATTLGSGVVNSSLTNLGTLTALTVSGAIDANGDLDVDGHTELDNLNVSGIATFASNVDINADLDVDGRTELDITNISETLNVSGIATFASDVDLNAGLDVDGHTELDNVNVSAASTFGGLVDINAGGQANTFKVEDLTDNRVVIAGTGGELEDSGNLTFNGSLLNVTGQIDATNIVVGSATTITSSGIVAGIVTGTLDNDLTLATSGTGLSGSATYNNSGAQTFTVTSNATDANTASTLVARDGSGDFSAGTITATLTGNVTGNLTGTATTATNLANGANITTGTISDDRLPDLITSNVNIVSGISSVATLDATNATIDNLTFTSGTAITSIDTDLSSVSSSDDTLASAKAIKTYIDTEVTAQDLDFQADTGGALSIDLDSETLSVVGTSNEIETAGSGNQIQIGLPNEVVIATSLVVGSATTINAAGIIAGVITATTFSGGLETSNLSGTITNAQLAGSIANSKLANSSVSFGGVSVALGAADATPAFDLSDATNYPTSSLTGTITNAQLAGSIANDKLSNSSVSFGGVSVSLGAADATPAFDLQDATGYPTSSLTGTITNAQLAGSIADGKLASTFLKNVVEDTSPQLGGTLDTNGNRIQFGDSDTDADDRLQFGAGSDLEIYHDGSNSFIHDGGTGGLYIRAANTLGFRDVANSNANWANFNSGGSVDLYHNGNKRLETTTTGVKILNGTTATIAGPDEIIIDPATVGDNTGVVRIKGDLFVDGTQTQINSTTLELADFVVGVATTATTDLLTDGAGIGIGSDKTFLYEHNSGTNPSLKSSENLNVASGKGYQINQTEVLNATTLGSNVVSSSLTSVGTLSALTVGGSIISNYGEIKRNADNSNFAITGGTASNSGGNLVIYGANHSSLQNVVRIRQGSTDRIYITSDGDIGINNSSPTRALSVSGSINIQSGERIESYSSSGSLIVQGGSTYPGGHLKLYGGSGDDKIEFCTSGSSASSSVKMTLKGDGKLGIGTDNPSDKLSIFADPNSLVIGAKDTTRGNHIFQLLADDAGGNGELRLYRHSASGTHEKVVEITSSGNSYFNGGNIGIGTDSPEEILHVAAASETVNSRDGVLFQSTSALAADTGLPIVFTSNVGTDSNYGVASIAGRKENANSGEAQGYLQFSTGNRPGTITEKVRITSDGKVGIGSISPAQLLDIASTAPNIRFTDTADGHSEIDGNAAELKFNADKGNTKADSKITFFVDSDEKLRIDSAGRLGIGGNGVGSGLGVYLQRPSPNTTHFYEASDGTKTMITGVDSTNDYVKIGALSNHRLGLVANNGEKVSIQSDGDVGINTTTPVNRLFVEEPTGTNATRTLVTFRKNHTTTTVSGNIAKDSFPHALMLENSDNSSDTGLASLGFTKFTSGAQSQAAIVGESTSAGTMDLAFHTESSNTIAEKVRIAHDGKVTMTSATNDQRGLSVIAPKTQINFGTAADVGGFLMSENNGQFGLSGGAYWNGSDWTATHTGSAQIRHDGSGAMVFATNNALTGGNTFTPTERLHIASDGNVRITNEHLRFDTTGKGIIFGINGGSDRPSIFGNYTSSSDNNMVFNVTGQERIQIQSNGQILFKGTSGDNQFTSRRTNAAGSNGDYFFHLNAQNSDSTTVGSLGFHRDTATDDSRFVISTRNTGGSNTEKLRITSAGDLQRPKSLSQEVSTSVSSVSATSCGSFAKATYRSAYVIAQITQGSSYQVGRYLVIHDGTTATTIEESAIATGDMLGTFSGVVSGSNVEFRVTMSSASSATVITKIESIVV